MAQNEKPKIEDLADEVAFWNSFVESRRAKGVDIAQVYLEWAQQLEQRLTSPGAREEFSELCKAGCLKQGLAALVLLLKNSAALDRFWSELVGQPGNRDRATRDLERAAQTLESLYSEAIRSEESREYEQFEKMGRVPISRLVAELRVHTKFINFAASVSADTETRSPEQFAKYLLTSYVRRMTGEFHDRCVSGLVGEALGPSEYNEVAHRMWRSRNYARIDNHFSWMVRFLVAMSVVIEHSA